MQPEKHLDSRSVPGTRKSGFYQLKWKRHERNLWPSGLGWYPVRTIRIFLFTRGTWKRIVLGGKFCILRHPHTNYNRWLRTITMASWLHLASNGTQTKKILWNNRVIFHWLHTRDGIKVNFCFFFILTHLATVLKKPFHENGPKNEKLQSE